MDRRRPLAVFRMSGDLRFSFVGNWAAPRDETSWTGWWRAIGESGIATGGTARKLTKRGDPEGASSASRARWPTSSPSLRTEAVPQGECHDNLKSLAMCHAAVESAALGGPVSVGGNDDNADDDAGGARGRAEREEVAQGRGVAAVRAAEQVGRPGEGAAGRDRGVAERAGQRARRQVAGGARAVPR